MSFFNRSSKPHLKDVTSTDVTTKEEAPSIATKVQNFVRDQLNSSGKGYIVLKKRISLNHPINVEKATPLEKFDIGIRTLMQQNALYKMTVKQQEAARIQAAFESKMAAIEKVAKLLEEEPPGRSLSDVKERYIAISASNQFILPELEQRIRSWKAEVIPSDKAISVLCEMPILIKFTRRELGGDQLQ